LTTVTDHRRTPLGKARAVRTAGNGSDQITIARSLAAHALFISVNAPCLARQKGARRPPAKTEKTLSPPPGLITRRLENPMPGVADLARPHATGGYPPARPPKPSVEPLFTCQRTPDFSGPAERGRVGRQTNMPADSFEFG
jgi:hypothetical protein